MTESQHQGLDVNAITTWYREQVSGSNPPLSFELLLGGHSNLTYRVTDANGAITVLRRPPLGELLPSAHDKGREHRVISALGPTAVPVAPALAHCEDSSVTGAPFYVMGFVAGAVLHDDADVLASLDEGARGRCGAALVEALAELHSLEVFDVGLADLGKHDGYVGRQLKRWYAQYQQSRGATPAIDRLYDALLANVASQQRVCVVHGDYRLGNCIVSPQGEILAILDWEICTLGDPLADLGYALATWSEPDDGYTTIATSPSALAGFARRSDLLAAYGAKSPLDLSRMAFYLAFSYWKVACINQGVWARYDQNQKSSEGVDIEAIRVSVDILGERAEEAFSSVSRNSEVGGLS